MYLPIEDAPDWAIEAGVDFENDEWEGHDLVDVSKVDGEIRVVWIVHEDVSMTAEEVNGTIEIGGGTTRIKHTSGRPKNFEKELESR